jgi:hypothetical protein
VTEFPDPQGTGAREGRKDFVPFVPSYGSQRQVEAELALPRAFSVTPSPQPSPILAFFPKGVLGVISMIEEIPLSVSFQKGLPASEEMEWKGPRWNSKLIRRR